MRITDEQLENLPQCISEDSKKEYPETTDYILEAAKEIKQSRVDIPALRLKLEKAEGKYRDAMEQLASACERADSERIPDDVLQTIIEFMDRPTAESRRNATRTTEWLTTLKEARTKS